jgi:hypothetical protein
MKKSIVNYPFGAGGRWLSHTLWSLENNCTEFPSLNEINFHNGGYSKYYIFTHVENNMPIDYTFSGRCKFNIFLNSWIKFRSAENYNNFNNINPTQQIFILSDEARWRFSDVYFRIYERKIDLDYGNIFLDTEKFRDQLLRILASNWPKEYMSRVTQLYIDSATAEFRKTAINPAKHLGNVESVGWLGWCHALCQDHNIEIPIVLETDFDQYKDWVEANQDWMIKKTRDFTI